MPLVNNYFDFSAGNSIKEIRKMETEMSKLLNISKSVVSEINKISNKKINLSLNTKGIDNGIKGVSNDINKINNKKIKLNLNTKDIENNIGNVSSRLKSLGTNVVQTMTNVNGSVSKLDNNVSSRGGVNGDFSMFYEGIASYAGQLSNAFLPSGASSVISGAANGFSAGMLTGNPAITIASTIIAAGAEWALSEVEKETDKKKQRIGFASNILTTYLPKIAMSSISYASDMEQSRLNYENILGKGNGNAFVDKMLEASNKNIYEYSDMDNMGKQMLAAGFDQKQTLRIFNAVGDASVARGGGKEEALQMMDAIKNMQTNGSVTLDNMDVFKNIDVDAYGILANSIEITGKKTRATKEELKDLISKGVIPADIAIEKLIYGLESKYAGMMYTQQQSFSGLISTIKDSANQIILGPLGEGFIKGIQPALASFASFFGLGTKGFSSLKDEIFDFGNEIGKLAGGAINTLKNTFKEFFNNQDFKDASLPDKFMMVFKALKGKADEWYKTGGKKLTDSIRDFFTKFFTELSTDSVFLDAVHGLWLAISPDNDTIKEMLWKAFTVKVDKEIDFENTDKRPDKNPNYGQPIEPRTSKAIGLNRVPYDYYPALLHEGEAVLRRTEADNYRSGVGRGVIISKIADTIVVKDETDMYKIANILVSEIEKAGLVYGGAM